MDQSEQKPDLTSITTDLVTAYVANNAVQRAELPNLIASVHAALQGLIAPPMTAPARPQPVVSIRKSVTPDYLISLEDGKKYKTLKRHLANMGLTPDEYRTKWGLPPEYPMVAPSYAARRSELAREAGLGRRRAKVSTNADVAPEQTATPKHRTSSKKG